jgi:hypothetical protein
MSTPAAVANTTAAAPYMSTIAAAAQEWGISPALLLGVLQQESGFNPNPPVGAAGDTGIAQFIPTTATLYGVIPEDPSSSIYGAAHYLSDLLNDNHGDVSAALSDYNSGSPTGDSAYVNNVLPLVAAWESALGIGSASSTSSNPAAPSQASTSAPGATTPTGGFFGPLIDTINATTANIDSLALNAGLLAVALAVVAGGFAWLAAPEIETAAKTAGKAAVVA